MKKTAIMFSSFAMCLLSFNSVAEAVDIYGRAHLGVANSDTNEGSKTSVESYSSRIGIKGSGEINEGLKAVYKFEFAVNAADQDSDGKTEENISARNQYVGLQGSYGQIVLGRHDTALKISQGKIDQMNDFNGDVKALFNGENRLGDVVHYSSPIVGNLQFVVTYIAEDNSKQDDETGISAAFIYGDSKLKNTPYFVSVAHDSQVAGYDITRFTAQSKIGDLVIGGMYQQSEKVSGSDTEDGFLLSASYKIDKYKLLAQYQDSEGDFGKLKDSGTGTSVGVERSLSKQARMYMWYTQFSLDNKADEDHLAVTLRYDF
ncbi:porin [Pseudoalteromonas lipolytica]|uniref:Porin n=1 Tax=Pseudoalteromonas lipolytica TaxID=570156 RepID=A0AAD0RY06_9GAMM|nr:MULTISPECIES: porin [Pseudoalteromonas]AXV64442.1 porin [Pseudoalteromonas donghaensis]QLJ08924.1 porin [Pseudoalteromonas sp. JSTW]QMW15156.1 porin [Pseudoalteromonas sp. MT33b]QPL43541.1 porin [Pseudoalteromonas sp. A41-2]